MNVLVFTTYDITPDQWGNFAKVAAVPPQPQSSDAETIIPYILVHSRTQQDLEATKTISTTVKSEFGSAALEDIKCVFADVAESKSETIHTQFFLMLDEQSAEDRKVIIMQKDGEWATPDGTEWEGYPLTDGRDDLTSVEIWKRHRAPFEKAFETWSLLDVEGGLDTEEYLEKVEKKSVGKVEANGEVIACD